MNDEPNRWTGGLDGASGAPDADGRNTASRGAASARILLVDDDPGVLSVFGAGLQLFNYEVDTAPDGDAAWAALCAKTYDLVITDHLMPKLTGLDLLRRLRAVRVDLPCILISGDLPSLEEDLAVVVRPGCALEKPIKLSEFVATVKALLAQHPVRRAAAQHGAERSSFCRS
ncbi:MAG TPA: response regulator [Opitutaceae bacterium]|nr:response regulator [Opitutaceae bacterium]